MGPKIWWFCVLWHQRSLKVDLGNNNRKCKKSRCWHGAGSWAGWTNWRRLSDPDLRVWTTPWAAALWWSSRNKTEQEKTEQIDRLKWKHGRGHFFLPLRWWLKGANTLIGVVPVYVHSPVYTAGGGILFCTFTNRWRRIWSKSGRVVKWFGQIQRSRIVHSSSWMYLDNPIPCLATHLSPNSPPPLQWNGCTIRWWWWYLGNPIPCTATH